MFKATINADLLKDSIESLSVLVDEARFRISPEGIAVRAVDPANVAMVTLDLAASAFDEFNANDCEIGMDLTKLTDILSLIDKSDKVIIELDDRSQKLAINIAGLSYTLSLLDPSTIRADPRIPQLDLPAEVVINGKDLRRAVKASEKISDHMLFGIEGDVFYMEAEGDTDRVRVEMTRDQLIDFKPENTHSLFSLDYLADIVKPVSKSNEVLLEFGLDFPIKISTNFANGALKVGYLLAPRIESD